MSQERILNTLIQFGLRLLDATVYLQLSTKGPQSTREIAEALSLRKNNVYSSLKRLRFKEVVQVTQTYPTKYAAVSLSRLMELLAKAKMKEANGIEQNRDEILSSWRSMTS